VVNSLPTGGTARVLLRVSGDGLEDSPAATGELVPFAPTNALPPQAVVPKFRYQHERSDRGTPELPGKGLPLLQSARTGSVKHSSEHSFSGEARELHEAAAAGDVERLAELLASDAGRLGVEGVDPVSGASLLHVLATSPAALDREEMRRALTSLGRTRLAVDTRAGNGSTALHWAAGGGHLEACEALVEAGADVFAVTYTWNRQIFGKGSGRTPLHWAAENGHEDCVEFLVRASGGAALGCADERGVSAAEAALGEGHLALAHKLERAAATVRFVCVDVCKVSSVAHRANEGGVLER
jgi:hypothetical protein